MRGVVRSVCDYLGRRPDLQQTTVNTQVNCPQPGWPAPGRRGCNGGFDVYSAGGCLQ